MTEETIQAYPLAWPPGWKRTRPQDQEWARFYRNDVRYENGKKREYICDLTTAAGVKRVLEQLDKGNYIQSYPDRQPQRKSEKTQNNT